MIEIQKRADLGKFVFNIAFEVASKHPRYAAGKITESELVEMINKRVPEVSDAALQSVALDRLNVDDQAEINGVIAGVVADVTRLYAERTPAAHGDYIEG